MTTSDVSPSGDVNQDGEPTRRDFIHIFGARTAAAGAGATGSEPAAPYVEVLDPAVVARLAAQGLTVTTHDEAVALWQDPAHALGMVVFIDARADSFYAEGHIPGAWQFDHYHQDRFLGTVLPVVTDPMVARVIVYCRGGDCEDSEFAAMNLMVRGVSPEKLSVYVGGHEAWKAAGMPLEQGERKPPEPPEPPAPPEPEDR